MSRIAYTTRVALALCAGGLIGAVLVPAVFTFNEPNGWDMWTIRSYLAYSVVALLFTLPTALITGAVTYPLLGFIAPPLRFVAFTAAGALGAMLLCVSTSPLESLGEFAIVGAISGLVAFVFLPPRSNSAVESDASESAQRASSSVPHRGL